MWDRSGDRSSTQSDSTRLPGVIDTIGFGYEALLSRPLLIVPPILLDLYFWLGLHITPRPLMVQVAQWLREWRIIGDSAARTVENAGPDNVSELAAFWTPTVGMPSFVATLSSEAAYRLDSWRPAVHLSWWGVLLAGLVMLGIGLIIGSEYLLALASAVSRPGTAVRSRRIGEGVLRGAWRIICWYVLVIGLALLVFWPVMAGFIAAELSGAGASFWLILLMVIPASWAFVLFFFSVQAMFVDDSGALVALRSSYRVVRSDSWNSLGLIVAYFLLTLGFPQVWSLLIDQPLGLMVAIVGHSIIGTGMIAATMVFYRDRSQLLTLAGHNQEG